MTRTSGMANAINMAAAYRNRRHILIVGGAGYIGSVLTEHLLVAGYRVRCFDELIYENGLAVVPYLSNPNYEFMRGDLGDPSQLIAAMDSATDVVLLAGLVGDPITRKYPTEAARINDDGHATMTRIMSGRGLNRVVFVSTCSNYGMIENDRPADEEHELKPLSPYAEAKVRMEKRLQSLHGQVDYTPTILRFATAFGLSPRMRFDLTVNEFTRTLFHGQTLLVYDAHTWRPYCHVQDFADVISRTLNAPVDAVAFEIFNAGGDVNNFTKKMIVETIMRELPSGRVTYQTQGSDPRNYRVSFAKIRERLGFEPRHTVCDGVRELVAALRQGLFLDISQPKSFHGNWTLKCAKGEPDECRPLAAGPPNPST